MSEGLWLLLGLLAGWLTAAVAAVLAARFTIRMVRNAETPLFDKVESTLPESTGAELEG